MKKEMLLASKRVEHGWQTTKGVINIEWKACVSAEQDGPAISAAAPEVENPRSFEATVRGDY